MDLIHPHTKGDVAEALREASTRGTRLLIVGGRRHMGRGNPCEVDAELWTTMLDGVVAYEPAEMLVVVEAGMRYGALKGMLAEQGQEWPVDAPVDATVGGVIAAGVSSTRRLRVGHVRDTVVEMELVTGDGRLIRSGARTVKNVTGYDLHRLATGSLGTLGVIVQVTLKTRPLPKEARTLATVGGGVALGERLLANVPLPVSIAARRDRVDVRLEGWEEEVEEQAAAVRETADVRDDVSVAEEQPDAPTVVEAAVPPSRLREIVDDGAITPNWTALVGVGLATVGVRSAAALDGFRARVAAVGGIAPAIRGPGGLGDAPVAALDVHRRLKNAFDPAGILAPGRFWGGL